MIGRFAPSPTGPLHAGSLVAAMASWLDVRAHEGRWLVRIEDVDGSRTVAGAEESIVATLAAHGFRWDAPIVRQSDRRSLYENAFETLRAAGRVYPCGCTRREVADAAATRMSDATGPTRYPGTCRGGLAVGRAPRAWRLRVPSSIVSFHDRAVGTVHQDVDAAVGDFVVLRADGMWAYQLAVVVDDAAQGVTDVVRGIDLIDSTPRQRVLQEALGRPKPRTLHVPLVLDANGEKLGKSRGARPLDASNPLPALVDAARHLDLLVGPVDSVDDFWRRATSAWAARWRTLV